MKKLFYKNNKNLRYFYINSINIKQNEKYLYIKKFYFKNYYSYPYPFFFIDEAYDTKTYSLLENDYKMFHSIFKKTLAIKKIIYDFK